MKKEILILAMGLLLVGCASTTTTYAPSMNQQKSLIKYGSIKKGMNMDELVDTLGGIGTFGGTYTSDCRTVWVSPKVSYYSIGTEEYMTMHYILELDPSDKAGCDSLVTTGEVGKGLKLTNWFIDPVELFEVLIEKEPNEEKKNGYIKLIGTFKSNSDYLRWKASKN